MTATPRHPAPGVERRPAPRYAVLTLVLALALGLCAGGAMAETSDTPPEPAAQMGRPLLAYRCPTGFETADALCDAFRAVLGRAAPGHALRRLAPGDAAPPLRDQDLVIALAARRVSDRHLTARLDWQAGDGAATVTGPELSLSSSDAAPGPSDFEAFLQGLWTISAPPALGGPARKE